MKKLKVIYNLIYRNLRFRDNNSKEWWDYYYTKNPPMKEINYIKLLDLLPKNERFSLLDIGCATGEGCMLIKKNFPLADINGCDISKEAIKIAKDNFNEIEFFVCNILNDNLPINRYDYIIFVETLEHFSEPLKVIDKCLNHTKRIIVSTPYKQKLIFKRFRKHKSRYDESTFLEYDHKIVKIGKYEDVNYGKKYILYEIYNKFQTVD